jgi:hypothetical protein
MHQPRTHVIANSSPLVHQRCRRTALGRIERGGLRSQIFRSTRISVPDFQISTIQPVFLCHGSLHSLFVQACYGPANKAPRRQCIVRVNTQHSILRDSSPRDAASLASGFQGWHQIIFRPDEPVRQYSECRQRGLECSSAHESNFEQLSSKIPFTDSQALVNNARVFAHNALVC